MSRPVFDIDALLGAAARLAFSSELGREHAESVRIRAGGETPFMDITTSLDLAFQPQQLNDIRQENLARNVSGSPANLRNTVTRRQALAANQLIEPIATIVDQISDLGLDPAGQILEIDEIVGSMPRMFEQLGRLDSGVDLGAGELDIFMNELGSIVTNNARGRETAFEFSSFDDFVDQILERGPGAAIGETIERTPGRGVAEVGRDTPNALRTTRIPGKRSAFRRGARAVGRVAGPASTALFGALDVGRLANDPTQETARSISREIANPVGSILEAITGNKEPARTRGGRVNPADPRLLNPIIESVSDMLFNIIGSSARNLGDFQQQMRER